MSRHYRIAMVAACPLPWPRGTPVRVYELSEALVARGHDVHVITYHLGSAVSAAPFPIHRIPNVPGYRRTSPGPTWGKLVVLDPLLAYKIRQTLRRVGRTRPFDVIHAHHVEGILTAWAGRAFSRIPIIFDAHTLLENELPHYRVGLSGRSLRRIGGWIDRRVPALADHVVTVSQPIKDSMINAGGLAEEFVTVAANGVSIDTFLGETAAGNERSGQPVDPGLVIFTGNLAPYQGLDLLLRAMVELRRRRPGVRLRIVTEDPADWPSAMSCDLGIDDIVELVHAGFDAVPGELARARVAVSPRTDCDGVPQKVLNYMAAGKPTVAFAGSARHIEDGVNGLIVSNGDTQAMAAAIERLLNAPAEAEQMGRNAREFVKRERSWDHTATDVEKVYARVVPALSVPGDGPAAATLADTDIRQ